MMIGLLIFSFSDWYLLFEVWVLIFSGLGEVLYKVWIIISGNNVVVVIVLDLR